MVHRLSRLVRSDDGAAALLTVILTSVVFIGLCALVVDLGLARDTRRQAQNAADASALAAGNALYLTGTADINAAINAAIAAAKLYATKNGVSAADWAACKDASALAFTPDSPDGVKPNTCISFDNGTLPTTVRVKVPIRNVSTPFAGIWGVSTVPVDAHAQIQLIAGGMAQCGLCVIGSESHNLQNGHITVNGASVAINGTLSSGPQGSITVSGSGSTIALAGNSDGGCNCAPTALKNQPPILDPLINLPMPDYSALTVHANTNTCPGVPGIYDHLSACGGMTPGLYVLTGSTSLAGNNGIVANGVTLDFVCSTSGVPRACNVGESGGGLTFRGNAYLNITAPTSGPNQGLSIVADRNYNATFSFGGNGAQNNSGTIYAASGTLAYNGNGASHSTDSLFVVGDFDFRGNPSDFVSSYTQSANVFVPSSGLHLSQ